MSEPIIWDGHGKHAQAVGFTRSGGLLVSTGQDAAIRVWSVPGFEPAGVFKGHEKSVNNLSFSPDESLLATGSTDVTVRIWSFPDGDPLHTLEKQVGATFSPDGAHLATIPATGPVGLWDPQTGQLVSQMPPPDSRTFALAFAPDGSELLLGGTGAIHRLSFPTGEVLAALEGHELAVPSLAFAPSGGPLASTGADGTLRFWSTEDWSQMGSTQMEAQGIYQLAFHPDGDRIAVSEDHLIQIFSVPDGQETGRFEVDIKGVYGVAISPDGRYLANAGADGKIRVWDLGT